MTENEHELLKIRVTQLAFFLFKFFLFNFLFYIEYGQLTML